MSEVRPPAMLRRLKEGGGQWAHVVGFRVSDAVPFVFCPTDCLDIGAAIILLNDELICMSIIIILSQVPFLASSSFPGSLSILLSYNHC